MKDKLPPTFKHGNEWLTKIIVDPVTWYTRPATKEEIKAAQEAKEEPRTIVVNGKTVPWTRPDPHTAFAGVTLPPGSVEQQNALTEVT